MKFWLSFPIVISFLLIIVLFAVYYQHKRLAYSLIIFVVFANYLFATPLMTQVIFAIIGQYRPLTIEQIKQQQAQAIVILGGGFYLGQEYNYIYQAGGASSQRLQYGAYLAQTTQLPIILSGMEAKYGMNNTLKQLGVTAKFLETDSLDTHQNAQYSAQLLHKQGIKHIILVTDAWHMSRAVLAFQYAGFQVTAAPTDFPQGSFQQNPQWWQATLTTFIHNTRGWSEIFAHLKYRLRYTLFAKA